MRKNQRKPRGRSWFKRFTQRNPRQVAWHKYVPDNKKPGTNVDDEERVETIRGVKHFIREPESPVTNKLNGKRPTPVGGPTDECFYADGTWYVYDTNWVAHKKTGEPPSPTRRIRLPTNNKFVELFMFYTNRRYFFVKEFSDANTRYISKVYDNRDEAMANSNNGTIRWVRVQEIDERS